MGQETLWLIHQMRDVWIDMWNGSTNLFIMAFIALSAASYFSLRRS